MTILIIGLYEYKKDSVYIENHITFKTFPTAIHEHIECIFVESGKLEMHISGTHYTLGEHEIAVIFPCTVHDIIKADADYSMIQINQDKFHEFTDILTNQKPTNPIIRDKSVYKKFVYLKEMLTAASERNDYYSPICIEGYLTVILSELLSSLKLEKVDWIKLDVVQRILIYCMDHYKEDISISKIAKALNYSKPYVTRIFSKKLKCRFNDYINIMRINSACDLLISTDSRICDIMLDCGFQNQSTFNKAFSKICKTSPNNYRKKYKSSSSKNFI